MNILRYFFPQAQSPETVEFQDADGKLHYGLLTVNPDSEGLTGQEVNIPNGQDVTLGSTTDAAVVTNTTGTVIGFLRGLVTLWLAGLKAGEAHIGEIGGYKKSAAIEFTRPADSTPYSALDCIGVSLAVTGATNVSPIVVTSAGHGITDGDPVTIASVGGNTAANGDFFAHVLSSSTFSLYSDAAMTAAVAGNGAYTSGGTIARLFKFTNMARIAAQNGMVIKGNLMTDQKTCVARVKVHLFSVPVTAILDNSPYLRLWVNRTKRSGEVIFPALSTEDPSNSTAAGALITPQTFGSNLPLGYGTQAADTAMYAMLETLDAFTPASGQSFYVRLMVEDD